jgi:hypothetical protein
MERKIMKIMFCLEYVQALEEDWRASYSMTPFLPARTTLDSAASSEQWSVKDEVHCTCICSFGWLDSRPPKS